VSESHLGAKIRMGETVFASDFGLEARTMIGSVRSRMMR
jgi:hypothetical protein